MSISAILAGAIIAALLYGAWRDLAVRLIPNAVPVVVALAGAGLRATQGLDALGVSLLAALVVFATLLLAWFYAGFGGADVKLAAAVSIGLPPGDIFAFLFTTAAFGVVLTLPFIIVARKSVRRFYLPAGRSSPTVARIARAEWRRLGRRGPLPYGVAIAAGGIVAQLGAFGG